MTSTSRFSTLITAFWQVDISSYWLSAALRDRQPFRSLALTLGPVYYTARHFRALIYLASDVCTRNYSRSAWLLGCKTCWYCQFGRLFDINATRRPRAHSIHIDPSYVHRVSKKTSAVFNNSVKTNRFLHFVWRSRGEMYSGHGCLSVCVSTCPSLHSHATARTRM